MIRPLAYVREHDLAKWAGLQAYPIIPCDLCGSQENLKRREMKAMLRDWETRCPDRLKSVVAALQAVSPSHLMDRTIHPFETLRATGTPDPRGDLAFDDDPCAPDGSNGVVRWLGSGVDAHDVGDDAAVAASDRRAETGGV